MFLKKNIKKCSIGVIIYNTCTYINNRSIKKLVVFKQLNEGKKDEGGYRMKLLQNPLTLFEIEKLLENELRDGKKNYRIIGDLDLTYEEYCFLELKSRGLKQYRDNLQFLEKYRLVILVTWVFGLRYATVDKSGYYQIREDIGKLKQYVVRKTLSIIGEAFDENALNTFGEDVSTLDGLFTIIGIHAGIPDNAYNKLFSLLEESLNYKDIARLELQIKKELDSTLTSVYEHVNGKTLSRFILQMREIYIDCRESAYTLEELEDKYIFAPRKFLERCLIWCEDVYLYSEEGVFALTK